MTHLEGPIVDSVYDTALISWHNALEPPLPSHAVPASDGGLPTFDSKQHSSTDEKNGHFKMAKSADSRTLPEVVAAGNRVELPEHTGGDPHYDSDIPSEVQRMQSVLSPRKGESRMQAVTRHLSKSMPSVLS